MTVTLVSPGVVDTPFFARRNRVYQRSWPKPMPVGRVARLVVSSIEQRREDVVVPGWLLLAARLNGGLPRFYRLLAQHPGPHETIILAGTFAAEARAAARSPSYPRRPGYAWRGRRADETTGTAEPTGPGLPTASVLVVMPAYNAARTLRDTWRAIPADVVTEVLLVDDHSIDATLEVASQLAIRTLALPHNVGYGGNQKACYLEALRIRANIVVMLHPDGQYDPKMIPRMIQPLLDGEADMVLGSRMLNPGGARRGKMPLYRFYANHALTWLENKVMGTSFSELHTGYRAYSRHFLQTVPFLRNSNDFVFDTQVIAQAVAFRQRVVEVPIDTRYHSDASSTSMRANINYGLGTLAVMASYALHKSHIWRSRLFSP